MGYTIIGAGVLGLNPVTPGFTTGLKVMLGWVPDGLGPGVGVT